MSTSVTEEMIEAGVRAMGGHRNSGEAVEAIYLAMKASEPYAGQTDVDALRQLSNEFSRWLENGPNYQPHYANGMRPFSTGDLKAFVEALNGAPAALLVSNRSGVEAAYRVGYDDGWCTGTAAMQADRTYNVDADWQRYKATALDTPTEGEGG